MGIDVVLSLPKGRVRVWMFCQAYQRGRAWYGCLYPYPYPSSGISTVSYPVPGYFPAGIPNLPKCWVRIWMPYQTYQSVGYGYGSHTKLIKESGTGNTRGMHPLFGMYLTEHKFAKLVRN